MLRLGEEHIATVWSTHYSFFISVSTPPRQGGASASFAIYQFARKKGFEPMRRPNINAIYLNGVGTHHLRPLGHLRMLFLPEYVSVWL